MRGGLSADQQKAIAAARRAFGQTLGMYATSAREVSSLAMAGYAGSFADLLCAASVTGFAADLVGYANEQLATAGYRIVQVRQ